MRANKKGASPEGRCAQNDYATMLVVSDLDDVRKSSSVRGAEEDPVNGVPVSVEEAGDIATGSTSIGLECFILKEGRDILVFECCVIPVFLEPIAFCAAKSFFLSFFCFLASIF